MMRGTKNRTSRPGRWLGVEALEARQLLAFIVWDGGGGDQSWDNPLNWSGDVLPGAADVALINAPGQQTVRLTDTVDRTVAAVWSLDGIELSGGSLTVTTQWRQSGPLTVSGGRIDGAAALLLNGDMSWTGGELAGSGVVRVLPGRTLTIGGDVMLARPVVNAGSIVWASGDISADGTRITNLGTATFTMASDGAILAAGAPSVLTNLGTVVRDGDAGTTSRIDITFNQFGGRFGGIFLWGFPPFEPIPAGIVEVRSGTLDIAGNLPLRTSAEGGDMLNGGTWIVRDAGTLRLAGGDLAYVFAEVTLDGVHASFAQAQAAVSIRTLTLAGGRGLGDFANLDNVSLLNLESSAIVTGINFGEVHVHGGTLTYRGTGQLGAVTLDGGTTLVLQNTVLHWTNISGAGSVRVVGNVEWQAGILEGPGPMVIGEGATFHIADNPDNPGPYQRYHGWYFGFDAKTIARRIVNFGTILWDDNDNDLSLIGELVNRGTFTIERYGSLTTYQPYIGTSHAVIINFGDITSEYDLTLRGASGGVALSNRAAGVVHVLSGSLRLFGGVSGGGAWSVDQGAALIFGGLDGMLAGGSIFGDGEIRVGNSLVLDSVAISGGGAMNILAPARVEVRGGGTQSIGRSQVNNAGTFALASQTGLALGGNLTNSGTLDLGYSNLDVSGAFRALGSSVVRMSLHQFVFPQSQFSIGGEAALGGALVIGLDWAADPGFTWQFLSAPSHSGAFASGVGADQADGRVFSVSWVGNLAWATLGA
jgi:hypothetical protein